MNFYFTSNLKLLGITSSEIIQFSKSTFKKHNSSEIDIVLSCVLWHDSLLPVFDSINLHFVLKLLRGLYGDGYSR